ncbi:hypothetical protein WA026_018099 [Henosepilachna vigintioctopunctata]|uniref:Uncharacterized protein n=1 Tax=Henosepilachna vigintioctopunctata TaxID=420089 RepID=A0AAW1UGU6_9CUCU
MISFGVMLNIKHELVILLLDAKQEPVCEGALVTESPVAPPKCSANLLARSDGEPCVDGKSLEHVCFPVMVLIILQTVWDLFDDDNIVSSICDFLVAASVKSYFFLMFLYTTL